MPIDHLDHMATSSGRFPQIDCLTGCPPAGMSWAPVLYIIRTINSENPDDNAWAKFERNDIDLDEFDNLFSIEADKKGFKISGKQVVKLLSGEIRKQMVDFLSFLKYDLLVEVLGHKHLKLHMK